MPRKQHLAAVLAASLFAVFTVFYLFSGHGYVGAGAAPAAAPAQDAPAHGDKESLDSFKGEPIGAAEIESVTAGVLDGGSIAPKLENATAK